MALKPCCDVYGTAAGVKKYRIHIEEYAGTDTGTSFTLIDEKPDFGPRGKQRLLDGIRRLMSPPTPRTKAEETS